MGIGEERSKPPNCNQGYFNFNFVLHIKVYFKSIFLIGNIQEPLSH